MPIHLSRLPDQFDRFHGYKRYANTMGVFDRFHMSEVAYEHGRGEAPGSGGLTPEVYRQVDGMLRLHGSYVVLLCMEPDDAAALIEQRYQREREMYDMDLVLRVNEWYDAVSRSWGQWEDTKYVMDVDAVFHETLTLPFPTDEFVDAVVEGYAQRLAAMYDTHTRSQDPANLCPLL